MRTAASVAAVMSPLWAIRYAAPKTVAAPAAIMPPASASSEANTRAMFWTMNLPILTGSGLNSSSTLTDGRSR